MDINKPIFIFILLILGYYFLVDYQQILFNRPQSIHQWAQCDRASVALNYYQNGFDFFHPQTHNLSNGTGITGLEFPLIQFIVALLYKTFGFHEYLYRLVIFLTLFTGLVAAFKISTLFVKNRWFALMPPLLLTVSPVLTYYGVSFLPEAASLGLVLMSWFLFIKYLDVPNAKNLILIAMLSSIAVLIKITALINPIAMLVILFTENGFSNFKVKANKVIPLLLSVIPVFAWYYYASWLNKTYNSHVFMLELRPLSSFLELKVVWEEILKLWWWWFYPKIYFIGLFAASLTALILYQNINKPLLKITLLLYAGSLAFFILMFPQFRVHDYYIIPLMPAFFFHWVLLSEFFFKISLKYKISLIFFLFMAVITGLTISDSKDHLRTAHNKSSWKYGSAVYDNYFNLEPQLRLLKIKKEDKVISLYDKSFNISLYLMNQKGITIGPGTPEMEIIHIISGSSFPYVILNNFDNTSFNSVMDSLNLGECILKEKELSIYKLNNVSFNK